MTHDMKERELGFSLVAKMIRCGETNVGVLVNHLSKITTTGETTIWGSKGSVSVAIKEQMIYRMTAKLMPSWGTIYHLTRTSLAHAKRLQGHSALWKAGHDTKDGNDPIETACGCSATDFQEDFPRAVTSSLGRFCQPPRASDSAVIEETAALRDDKRRLQDYVDALDKEFTMLRDHSDNLERTTAKQRDEIRDLKEESAQAQKMVHDLAKKLTSLGKRARDLADDTDLEVLESTPAKRRSTKKAANGKSSWTICE